MSRENSPKDSQSESSNSSPNPVVITQKDLTDLTLFGAPAPLRLNRSATVRRASTVVTKKEEPAIADDHVLTAVVSADKYRKSLDGAYRHSLESISEYRAKSSFSSSALYPSRNGSSLDSTSSDCTDYAVRSSTETCNTKDLDKTFTSPSSSYLSWIESVNSEYFTNTPSTGDTVDVDNKVGEWNNFWLNYNSPHNRYLSSHYLCTNEDKTGEDISDCKSSCSTQKDFNEKLSTEHVLITYDEITEIIRCSQRITEILQRAIKRNDEIDQSRNDSYYSQFYSQQTTSYDEDLTREGTFTYVVDPQELQKQKQLLKPPSAQTNSCINVLLNTGVADILKRVISKRREVIAPEDGSTTTRSSFCDWSSGK